jgi:peptide/nickel transport system substrate-binding protein
MFRTAAWHARRGRTFAAPALLLTAFPLVACRSEHTPERDRVLVIATAADPDHLFPPAIMSTSGLQVADLIFERLAEPDSTLDILDDATYRPRLADGWTWASDSLSIAFRLNAHARWHDGVPVTAHDVRFTLAVYRAREVGSPVAPLLANVESVSVHDPHTATFWFRLRYAQQFYDATYHMRVLPEHLLGALPPREISTHPFARAPVGSGPFRFARWVPSQVIELLTHEGYYRPRPRFDRVLLATTPNPHVALAKLRTGEADFLPRLHPNDISAAASDPRLRIVRWSSLSSGLVLLNLRDPLDRNRPHPILGDRGVRWALSMAVDRDAMVAGTMGAIATPALGPLPAPLLGTDSTLLPRHDPERARDLLDSLGWRVSPSARARQAGGRPLAFTLLVPGEGSTGERTAIILQQQLARVGAAVRIELIERTAIVHRLATRRFDAALLSLDWDPSPASVRQLWSTAAIDGGSNFGGYSSPAFDSHVARAVSTTSRTQARVQYRRAWEVLAADAPALWLYDLSGVAAARRCLRPAGLRADDWWAELPAWSLDSLPCSPRRSPVASAS